MTLKYLIRGAASAMVLAGLSAGQALAQDQDENQETVFSELVVTAQKREQRLQDVPIVVTVATEQLLEDAGVKDIRDLSILTPGLTVTATSSEASVTARIRGVGTVGDNPGLESSVGVVIDGVYRPRNGVGFEDLGDVSRIEVLKGPQGTLFGKNTSAGVINVVTKEPSFNPQADLEVTGGNYSLWGGSVNVTGALVAEKVAGSLFVAGRQRDGIIDVNSNGSGAPSETNDQNYWTARAQLLALPNEKFSARIIADYTNRDEQCCAAPQLYVGRATGNRADIIESVRPGSVELTGSEQNRVAYANRPYMNDLRDGGLSGELNYDLSDNVKLTSITAWREWKGTLGSDADYTGADLIYVPTDGSNWTKFGQISEEVRLTGEHGKLNWTLGVFAAKEDLDAQQVLNYGTDLYPYLDGKLIVGLPAAVGLTQNVIHTPGHARIDNYTQNDKSIAVFTNNDYQVTDALTATLGLRLTRDEKDFTGRYQTFAESCQHAEASPLAAITAVVGGLCVPFMNADFDALGVHKQTKKEEDMSGTFKLAYRFTPQIMAYASASKGYKAGGFNLDREPSTCGPDGSPFIPAPAKGSKTRVASPAPTHPACPVRASSASPSGFVLNTGSSAVTFGADPDTSFPRETVQAYELGTKTQWFDNSLLFNATIFYQEYKNFQLNTFVSPSFIVTSLPTVRSRGIDMDLFWNTPVKGLTVQGGATIADTIIGNFYVEDIPTNYSDYAAIVHLRDRRLSFAPKYTASLAGTYETDISDTLSFRANISTKYNSAYNTGSDLAFTKVQEGFFLTNARLGVGTKDDKWRVELWGNNILDEDYIQVGFNGAFQVDGTAPPFGSDPSFVQAPKSIYDAFLGMPRTFGVTLRAKLK